MALALSSRAVPAQEMVVRYGDVPIQDWLPLWVMRDKGIGKKVGLDLRAIKVQGGTELNALIMADQADLIINANVLVLLMATQGLIPDKATVLELPFDYADKAHPLAGLIVSDKIKSWKDLEGKTVATHFRRSLLGMALVKRMRIEGVDVNKVNIVEVPLPQQELALKAGRVDAISPGSDFAARILAANTGRLMSWYVGEPPFDDYMIAFPVMRTRFYRENPQAAERLVRGFLLALQWIEKNPEEAKQLAAANLGIKEPEAIARFPLFRFNPGGVVKGEIGARSLRLSQEMLIDEGLLKAPVDLSKLFTGADLVSRIRRELGIREDPR